MEIYGWALIVIFIISIILALLSAITFKNKPIIRSARPKKTFILWMFVGQIAIMLFLLPTFINYYVWAIILFIYTIVLAIVTIEAVGNDGKSKGK